ncbi:Homocysteine S-methyltransferase [Pseudoneurospora amorphoporcata]|uniref:Homocysteine S-methyltransferase n=1 Tax=Pseudoneurospora amorphoporcata TaxID=241081 RepID=A0AAN6SCC4_9PEZI|nr:Homocysteine S-methyltransferase [Pseudoneurospora amorphoporcata]
MATPIPVQLLDGGLGTTLEDLHDIKFSFETPLWSSHLLVSDEEDKLLDCHKAFEQAGANIISTATYQTSIRGFAATKAPKSGAPDGIEKEGIPHFLDSAVVLAANAAGREGKVALALGPYGATMIPSTEYSGKYDPEHQDARALEKWHKERLDLFKHVDTNQVSYIAFETVPTLGEIDAVRNLLSADKIPTSLRGRPVWISSLYPNDDEKLPDGSTVEEVVKAVLTRKEGLETPWGIGINCTKVEKLDSLVKRYQDAIQTCIDNGEPMGWPSLVLYPDGTNGEVYNTANKTWELPPGQKQPEAPWEATLADVVEAALQRGKWKSIIVGGCCKTSPEHIRKLRKTLQDRGHMSTSPAA